MKYAWTALLLSACAVGSVPLHGQVIPGGATVSTRPDIDTLIEQLGDRRFAVRDRATETLSALEPAALDELVRRYRAEPRYEQKLRLRYAIENVYYRKLMAGQVGFLGVTPGVLNSVYDPRRGQTVECIVMERVIEGTAADRGGLRSRDILLDFDGQPVAHFMKPPAAGADQKSGQQPGQRNVPMAPDMALRMAALEAFTSHVKMRQPGTRIPMRVLRLGESKRVNVRVGSRTEELRQPQVLAATMLAGDAGQGLMLGAVGGLVVTQVPERSWLSEARLRVNDVIVGIGNQPVPPGATPQTLDNALQNAGPNREIMLEVRPLEQVELTVVLGARAPEMMNQPDWEEAQKRFAAWWREVEGEPSLRIRQPNTTYFASATLSPPPAPEPEVVP
ncbi:MAG TPA: hypothetical protein PKG54_11595 [Phycisphaerae bacterium]|jgi:hypothetical protein|nr:hypothetical protein [Phycisphaerae bacterium]HOB75158.1 hypothetical protein [Phycisphaerae bacterium]HOJ54620.1 hypothetical protein [Phycisphaerae bacterium]HOL27246.1 hypothetical protein [Phycisphaerae bacterium]HPP21046.1 hypothetical protein [Phycisphaerae bacterium]